MWAIPILLPVVFTENDLLRRPRLLFVFLVLLPLVPVMAQTATITGIVLDEDNNPLADVNIVSGATGTSSDPDGFYQRDLRV